MTCTESRPLLHAQVDGELDLTRCVELERHLKTCAACAAAYQSLLSLKTALRQPTLRYEAPDDLRREVRQLARAPKNEAHPRLMHSLRLWKALAFGAATFALLIVFLRPGLSERDEMLNEAVGSHVRSLLVDHLTDVSSSDQHTVKPWFNGKLDFAPEVKDFTAEGFALIGGRLDYLNGRAVAALVYRHEKHLINVFVWPAANQRSGKRKVENRRGYSLILFETEGFHYCLVSDVNKGELLRLASLLRSDQR